MNAEDHLAEAARHLGAATESEELNALQRAMAQHLAGMVDGLGKSVVRLQAADEPADLRADGGRPTDRDPIEEPTACSKCGVHIGLFGDEYCDPCARELGEKPPIQRCLNCSQRAPQEQMKAIDLSRDDEYYPEIAYLCRDCAEGNDGT